MLNIRESKIYSGGNGGATSPKPPLGPVSFAAQIDASIPPSIVHWQVAFIRDSTCENCQTRAIRERSGFGDLVFRRSHAAVSRSSSTRRCFPCPRAFLPKTTSIRSPSIDVPAIHDDDHVRRADRATLARDGLRTMPPPPPRPGRCILVLVVRCPSLYQAARCLRHQVRRIRSSNPRHGVKGNSGRRVGSDDERSSVEPQY